MGFECEITNSHMERQETCDKMKIEQALKIAEEILANESFDRVTLEQDKDWDTSLSVKIDFVSADMLYAFEKIMKKYPLETFNIEGDSIEIFTADKGEN